jgi:hypothetical protein
LALQKKLNLEVVFLLTTPRKFGRKNLRAVSGSNFVKFTLAVPRQGVKAGKPPYFGRLSGLNPKTWTGAFPAMAQGSLFDCLTSDCAPPMAGLAGVMPSIRAAMARAARAYPEGRKSLPEAVSEVAQRENVPLTPKGGKTASLDLIHKWLASSDARIYCFISTR